MTLPLDHYGVGGNLVAAPEANDVVENNLVQVEFDECTVTQGRGFF